MTLRIYSNIWTIYPSIQTSNVSNEIIFEWIAKWNLQVDRTLHTLSWWVCHLPRVLSRLIGPVRLCRYCLPSEWSPLLNSALLTLLWDGPQPTTDFFPLSSGTFPLMIAASPTAPAPSTTAWVTLSHDFISWVHIEACLCSAEFH